MGVCVCVLLLSLSFSSSGFWSILFRTGAGIRFLRCHGPLRGTMFPVMSRTKQRYLTFTQILECSTFSLSIKIAQKPCIVGSLGPKALKHESFEGKGFF